MSRASSEEAPGGGGELDPVFGDWGPSQCNDGDGIRIKLTFYPLDNTTEKRRKNAKPKLLGKTRTMTTASGDRHHQSAAEVSMCVCERVSGSRNSRRPSPIKRNAFRSNMQVGKGESDEGDEGDCLRRIGRQVRRQRRRRAVTRLQSRAQAKGATVMEQDESDTTGSENKGKG
ncbi:hypothetical protein FA95DRAFT_1662172 [Auriscalpium vulgare]|uniref:Uncharacterized protein n=1 Tax=Auriscalpium vulgare TaxID=40419 RepID=A0ACB8R3C1_9AGAM|nr:hypothetical protein FA95DRAFT_1662172 [Auriscalpium vulgare]